MVAMLLLQNIIGNSFEAPNEAAKTSKINTQSQLISNPRLTDYLLDLRIVK